MGAPRHQNRKKEPTLWKTYQRDNFDLREELGSTRTLCASQLMEAPRHQNRNIEPALWKTNHTDHRDLYVELDGTREICASQLMEAPRYQNRHKESTLTTDKSKEYCYIQDNNGGEQSIEIMNFISLLKTEDVAVKDSVDDISSNLQETRTAISPLNSSGNMKTFLVGLSCKRMRCWSKFLKKPMFYRIMTRGIWLVFQPIEVILRRVLAKLMIGRS